MDQQNIEALRHRRPHGHVVPRPAPRPAPSPGGLLSLSGDLVSPDRIVKPLGITAIAAVSTGVGLRMNWPCNGRALGITCYAVDPTGTITPEQASALVQVQVLIDGQEQLITNGESGDWASLRGLCPAASPWMLIDRAVQANRPWLVTFRNLHASLSLQPELMVGLRSEQR